MESSIAGRDWIQYFCKSGELLFYYNKVTSEHRWPAFSYDNGIVMFGRPLISVGTQTDIPGCNNGCICMANDNRSAQSSGLITTGTQSENNNYDDNACSVNSNLLTLGSNGKENSEEQEAGNVACAIGITTGTQSENNHYHDNAYSVNSNLLTLGSNGKENSEEQEAGNVACVMGIVVENSNALEKTQAELEVIEERSRLQSLENSEQENTGENEAQSLCDLSQTYENSFSDSNEQADLEQEVRGNEGTSLSSEIQPYSLHKQANATHARNAEELQLCNFSSLENQPSPLVAYSTKHLLPKESGGNSDQLCSSSSTVKPSTSLETDSNEKLPSIGKDKQYKCEDCGQLFTHHMGLRWHKRTHQKQDVEPPKNLYQCEVCEKKFKSLKVLETHQLGRNARKTYSCSTCGKELKTPCEIVTHKRSHKREKKLSCNVCSKKYASLIYLQAHQARHTGEKLTFSCDKCEKTFSLHTKLLEHKRLLHTNNIAYSCDVCGKVFARLGWLTQNRRFNKEKSHSCSICGKSFSTRYKVKLHKTVHSGEKCYKCQVCGKSFRDPSNRSSHQKRHSGAKDYKCEICGRAFAYRSCVKAHQHVHTGIKAFKCNVCGVKYARRESLKYHQRSLGHEDDNNVDQDKNCTKDNTNQPSPHNVNNIQK